MKRDELEVGGWCVSTSARGERERCGSRMMMRGGWFFWAGRGRRKKSHRCVKDQTAAEEKERRKKDKAARFVISAPRRTSPPPTARERSTQIKSRSFFSDTHTQTRQREGKMTVGGFFPASVSASDNRTGCLAISRRSSRSTLFSSFLSV